MKQTHLMNVFMFFRGINEQSHFQDFRLKLETDGGIVVTFANMWCFYRFRRLCKCGFVLG